MGANVPPKTLYLPPIQNTSYPNREHFLNKKFIREGIKSRLNSRFPCYKSRQNISISKRRFLNILYGFETSIFTEEGGWRIRLRVLKNGVLRRIYDSKKEESRFYRILRKEELQKNVFRKQEGRRDGQNGCENQKEVYYQTGG